MRVVVAVIVVMFVGSSAVAQTNWELVSSKEGGFSVEMPTKPTLKKSHTRKENGGVTKVMQIGCETDGGVYIVQKIEFPTAIVKGAENEQLDAERDGFAEVWRGKVIGEKKVRANGRVGRDFTIRGKPEKDSGVLTVRIREYLDEKAVYAVIVCSAPIASCLKTRGDSSVPSGSAKPRHPLWVRLKRNRMAKPSKAGASPST